MSDFKMKREIRKPAYCSKTLAKSPRRHVLSVLMALSVATALNTACYAEERAKMGIIAIPPIKSHTEFVECVQWKWKGEELILQTNKIIRVGEIEFEADAYDSRRKIAYEWVGAPDYNRGDPKKILSQDERKKVVNYLYKKGYTIVIIENNSRYDIMDELDRFLIYYQKRNKK